ncbi:bifunctional 4-hydroxy-2-oxoglutarate aldolase/2-dehydro-3-deoxy-phosphogluconate aldolase [Virgibacillus senegalensis]|uniref:bifunctional 4-hydroxy-2-oxoglutarate aldolase/2-dehydro-3-deoxy-phosphogluconate aldolase n=1 Tax=Virgibacillus senegalensis TaxID=1499679 RepID=UPI00069DE114|nr:bifunctional 4-hydroxy-2-oxoglutarate aldolase/2-dehydro-3-deoxy-phosphogluconate aldolase [Virgibacillus senegalensis]
MNEYQRIRDNSVIAVIRGAKTENVLDVARSLLRGGVKTLEIAVDHPSALEAIKQVRREFREEVIVGAGTILDPETARSAIMTGAQFIFSPTVNIETLKMTKRYGILNIAGAMTPTEILTAFEHGSEMVKVFPANVFGPSYIKDIHGPFPQIPLIPTGGINGDNAASYLGSGAAAVGVGSSLVNMNKQVNERFLRELEENASMLMEKVRNERDNDSLS